VLATVRLETPEDEAAFAQLTPIGVLPRSGFVMAGPLGFHLPGPDDNYLQLIELRPGGLSGLASNLRLHPAFDELEQT
jgi:hypothetical protein